METSVMLLGCANASSQSPSQRCCSIRSPLAGLKSSNSISASRCTLDAHSQSSSTSPTSPHAMCTLASTRTPAHNAGKDRANWSLAPMRSNLISRSGLDARWHQSIPRAKDDDFDVDEDAEFEVERVETEDDEEEDFRDYETEYESPVGYIPMQKVLPIHFLPGKFIPSRFINLDKDALSFYAWSPETDSFMNTEGEEEESVVSWKINEEEFHKFKLLTCDFFIRKVPDADDDVYDFREMYVTPTDTDVYSIPKVMGKLAKKPVRCRANNWEVIYSYEPPLDEPRAPLCKTEMEVMKVFLMKHLKDRRAGHPKFMLDFEEIYVIDCKNKSFSRADVQVEVPGGKNRDRTKETLVVRDSGTSFRIILEEDALTPDDIVLGLQWDRTRENMGNYLKGFRDYEISNWF